MRAAAWSTSPSSCGLIPSRIVRPDSSAPRPKRSARRAPSGTVPQEAREVAGQRPRRLAGAAVLAQGGEDVRVLAVGGSQQGAARGPVRRDALVLEAEADERARA